MEETQVMLPIGRSVPICAPRECPLVGSGALLMLKLLADQVKGKHPMMQLLAVWIPVATCDSFGCSPDEMHGSQRECSKRRLREGSQYRDRSEVDSASLPQDATSPRTRQGKTARK